MKGRPETAIENPNYLADMVEVLAYLTDEELGWLTHPRDGLHTVSRYLPTPADVHAFLRDRKARLEAVRPAPTNWRKLGADDPAAPWNAETDYERKARLVQQLLGYNPAPQAQMLERARAGAPTAPTAQELRDLKLKTPAAPPSSRLKALLREQGYPVLTPEEGPHDDGAASAA